MIIKRILNYVTYHVSSVYRRLYEKYYYKKLRKKLKNKDFSLISPNCYAGIIYHRLGLEFKSPTINMLFPIKKQYLKFASNLKFYLSQEIKFVSDEKYSCPVGMLDDVKIVFNHDTDESVILSNWERRKKRINYDNLFITFDDLADAEYEDLVKFNKIDCTGKIIFTAKKYEDLDNTVQIKKYKKTGKMQAYLMDKSIWTGKNPSDRDFDFVEWLNNGI